MKIIFLGTSEFGSIILEKLCENDSKPILVITATDKPVGRKQVITPPPVKTTAQKYDIPTLQPEKIEEAKAEIKKLNPDLIVVIAYGQLIPKEILEIPRLGCINIHPSLLPKYRGPSPIQYAILNGDDKTGVTIMQVDEKFDHGPILNQRSLQIEASETAETLHNKLAVLGADLLMETITKLERNMIKPIPQDESQATFTKPLSRESGMINWKKAVQGIEREIRALYPWPGSYVIWDRRGIKLKIKVLKARIYKSPRPDEIAYPIGKTLVVPQNEIGVQCGGGYSKKAGDFLVIEILQLEGKKEMKAEDFLRGYPDFIGTILF